MDPSGASRGPRLAAVIGLGLLALWLAGPSLAAQKPKKPESLIREGYGAYRDGEVGQEDQGGSGVPSTILVPDPSAPGGYRFQLEEPGVTGLPGQTPSVIPDPSAPAGYRYQPGILSDPDAAPGQAPRVVPDPNAPGGYRINPLPGEADTYLPPGNQPGLPAQPVPPGTPADQPETGLLPQFRWPGEDPAYRQHQEQQRQTEREVTKQRRRYPWEPYQDRRSLRFRDQRQQERETDQD